VAVYRRPARTRYLLAVLILAALTLVTIDARSQGSSFLSGIRSRVSDGFAPLQRATHAVLRPIGDFLTGAADYGSLRSENQHLRDQVAALQGQSQQASAEQAAAQEILGEAGLPFVGTIPTVAVEVIDSGASNFDVSVTIDKGTSSGIALGQPVVSAGGLVGTVSSVGKRTATVLLLTDPSFAVGVSLPGKNVGTAQGGGRGQPLRVTVDTTDLSPPSVANGQVMLTSGLDLEKFPPYIPVGKVVSHSTLPGSSEPSITLSPVANLSQLVYLRVLLWSPQ
jgi:rod shape-determining protein MreC